MSLSIGSRLGPYEILAPVGAGGMGEVYRARDTRLDRTVAIKVLPERLWRDEEMRQRFEREAKLISRLSHPHICAVYDVGRAETTDYLVMEYLEGETLADRLAKSSMPLPLILRYAREIAEGLDAAHRQGIVHRDLKPGNVMLTKEGVKLLDFGLAKVAAPALAREDATSAETARRDLTQEGVVVGTVQYMSPEQLEAKEADARSDIFAFGAVLYEMVAGKKAFSGGSRASVIAAILERDPQPASSSRSETPPALDRLLSIALAKDPEDRWQSARDVGLQLALIRESSETTPAAGQPRRRSRTWPWVAAATAFALAAALLFRVRPASEPQTPIRFRFSPPPGAAFVDSFEGVAMAFSPDGTRLAVLMTNGGASQIWQRALSDPEPHPIPGTEGARSLFWSPDGRSIGFFVGDKLKRLDLPEGAPVTICDFSQEIAGSGGGRSGTWSPGGDILFAGVDGSGIYRVPSAGGRPEILLRPDPKRLETRISWPWFLPGGSKFLYSVRRRDGEGRIMMFEPGRAPHSVVDMRSSAQYVDPGYLVYVRDGALIAQRFDPDGGQVAGTPFSLAPQVAYFASTGAGSFATSKNGALAFRSAADVDRLAWFDRSGKRLGDLGAPGNYLDLAISPDAKRLLFSRARAAVGTYDVWLLDLERNAESAVTSDPDSEFAPVWFPDGKSILYSSVREASPQLFRRELVTGREAPLLPAHGFQEALDISPDARTVAYAERRAGHGFEYFTMPLSGDSHPQRFSQRPEQAERMKFSPDGRAVAFVAGESGRSEVYVAPSGTAGERIRVSIEGADSLCWSRDGREILYLGADRQMMAVPVRTAPSLEVGRPAALFKVPAGNDWLGYDVMPDGRILAIVRETPGNEQPATVAIHWTAQVPKN